MAIRNKILTPLALFIISLILIITGAVLTVSIIFILFGIPLLIIGVILFILSIFLFVAGTLDSISSLFRPRLKLKKKINVQIKPKQRKKGKIIDVKEKKGVYEAE